MRSDRDGPPIAGADGAWWPPAPDLGTVADSRRDGAGTMARSGPAAVADTPAPPLVGGLGPAARAERSARLDVWLRGLLPPVAGVALLAVGGLGRRECLRHSDLDLVLVHSGRPDVYRIADAVWYPVWDAGMDLDHSVRTVPEMLAVGDEDVKAALGLLDARFVAGDRALAERIRAAVRVEWRRRAPVRLAALRELTLERWERFGELAYEPEGDIKEARGGLRDGVVLGGIALAQLVAAPRPAVAEAYQRLLDVREAVGSLAGRRLDRLIAEHTRPVADLVNIATPSDAPGPVTDPTATGHGAPAEVGRPDSAPAGSALDAGDRWRRDPGLALRARIADDARTISYAVDDAWRAVRRLRGGSRRAGRSARRPLDDGVVEQDGEVVLARSALAPERCDPALPVRVTAAAAASGLPVAAATLEWLAAACPAPPEPWPAPFREAFLRLLDTGPGLVGAWEAADRYGLITRWIPEWAAVRNLPQAAPVHRHTVDRHLVQAVVCAGAGTRDVSRPDLLLLAALLHDIGKGTGGDHAAVGAHITAGLARRMGLPAADVAILVLLVRHHLLLPDTATRRDLDDPVTLGLVAERVESPDTLDLLAALAVADATAAGPLASSPWRQRLVADLVSRVRAVLSTGELPAPRPPESAVRALAGTELPAVRIEPDRVTLVARAEPGMLAAVAGCLAAHRLTVQGADIVALSTPATAETPPAAPTTETSAAPAPSGNKSDKSAVEPFSDIVAVECTVRPDFGTGPDPARLAADLRRAVRGEFAVADRLAARERGYERAATPAPPPRVVWHDGAATGAVVLELRAADRIGLLYRVALALAGAGAWVRAARIATLGSAAVDSFYLVGDWSGADRRAAVTAAVLDAAGGEGHDAGPAR